MSFFLLYRSHITLFYRGKVTAWSDVETVLTGEGINLRDKTDTFRNFGDVLDEVAGKWTSYSDVSKRAIAKAMAGKQGFVPEHTVTYECRLQNIALRMVPYRERARDGEFRGKTDIFRIRNDYVLV